MLGKDSKLQYIIKKGRIYQEVRESGPGSRRLYHHGFHPWASGFQEFFIGSNAYRIISATDRPVITIRRGNCPENIDKIVLPVDNTIDSRQKVPFTVELAKIFRSEIHVVGIQTSKSGARGQAESALMWDRWQLHPRQVAWSPTRCRAMMLPIWWLTMPHGEGRHGLHNNGTGGATEPYHRQHRHQVLNKSEIPVLSQSPKNLRITGSFSASGGDFSPHHLTPAPDHLTPACRQAGPSPLPFNTSPPYPSPEGEGDYLC